MDPSKLLEILKLSPKSLLGIFIGTGVLVFAPNAILIQLGLTAVVSVFRGWIGGVFVLSGALLLSSGLDATIKKAWSYIIELREAKRRRKSFQYLSPPEKAMLAKYYNEKTSTLYISISDGIANGLAAKGYIYRASNIGAHGTTFPFNIQPWAWNFLHNDPSLVLDIK